MSDRADEIARTMAEKMTDFCYDDDWNELTLAEVREELMIPALDAEIRAYGDEKLEEAATVADGWIEGKLYIAPEIRALKGKP